MIFVSLEVEYILNIFSSNLFMRAYLVISIYSMDLLYVICV